MNTPRPRLEVARPAGEPSGPAVLDPIAGGKARTILRAVTLFATTVLVAVDVVPGDWAAAVTAVLTGLELALGALTHGSHQ